jgi:hypothetical protein
LQVALCQVGFTNREHLGLAPEASFAKPSYLRGLVSQRVPQIEDPVRERAQPARRLPGPRADHREHVAPKLLLDPDRARGAGVLEVAPNRLERRQVRDLGEELLARVPGQGDGAVVV